jgi:tRNA threonylcarbamoyladenosine biosynthesis protein TsaE
MVTFISKSPEETIALGEKWGQEAKTGWLIGLRGDLGAGKTQLVKGFARGLGVRERVHSPSFALVNEYSDGRLPLFHLDLYRLQGEELIIGAGLEEYLLRPRGITVVEWIDRWLGEKPAPVNLQRPYRDVRFAIRGENERLITHEDFSA